MLKKPPASGGDTGSIPGQKDLTCVEPLTRAPQLLSLGSSEPTCHSSWSPHAPEPALCTREAAAARSPHTTAESRPHLPVQQGRPSTDENGIA